MKLDEEPDMIMMTPYADLDLDESPIIVLGWGHFFTIETLDGLVALKDVYKVDSRAGQFCALIENAELAVSVPQCPNCRCPIKQYVTKRYNRLINRAVIDETSKRFIVQGQQELLMIETGVDDLGDWLENSHKNLVPNQAIPGLNNKAWNHIIEDLKKKISKRYNGATVLRDEALFLRRKMSSQYQPSHALHEATVYAITHDTSLDVLTANMNIQSSGMIAQRNCDQRIASGARRLGLRIRCMTREDKSEIYRAVKPLVPVDTLDDIFRGSLSIKMMDTFLRDCNKLIEDCTNHSLPKIAVETTLYYSRIAYLLSCSGLVGNLDRDKAADYRNKAKEQLRQAEGLCSLSFRDRDGLVIAIEKALIMLDDERYERVSEEEMQAIKKAMLSGSQGIATHSGHWYNCVNGHPVSNPSSGCNSKTEISSSLSVNAECLCNLHNVQSVVRL